MNNENTDRDDTTVEVGSGNVFADLGFPDAEEMLVKAQLVHEIDRIVTGRRLKQAQVAKLLGIEQPDVSNLLRGRMRGYSVDRLLRFLAALDQDVEITIRPAQCAGRKKPCGKITVVTQ
jgi:predicted XRE-type DNA-binding protein